jgi:hypothetical protein
MVRKQTPPTELGCRDRHRVDRPIAVPTLLLRLYFIVGITKSAPERMPVGHRAVIVFGWV